MKTKISWLKIANNFFTDKELIKYSSDYDVIAPLERENLSGTSYDLRVGKALSSRNLANHFDISSEPYFIESGEVVTINSLEEVNFRQLLCMGILCNKHSILAKGLFHPMTVIDPGFRGILAITFINIGNTPYKISYGEKICKLCIFPNKTKPTNIYGSTQSPSFKEGSLDIANIYNTQSPKDKDVDLSKMYGAPFQELIKRIEKLEHNYPMAELQVDAKRKKENTQNHTNFLIALIPALIAVFLTMYWDDLLNFITPYLPSSLSTTSKP